MSSNLSRAQIDQVFNISSNSNLMRMLLYKVLPSFFALNGIQGIHMSPYYIVSNEIKGNFDGVSMNQNYIDGVSYIHKRVELKKVFLMYKSNRMDSLANPIIQLMIDLHSISSKQLKNLYTLSDREIDKLQNVSLQLLVDVGIDIDSNTIESLIKIAIEIGK